MADVLKRLDPRLALTGGLSALVLTGVIVLNLSITGTSSTGPGQGLVYIGLTLVGGAVCGMIISLCPAQKQQMIALGVGLVVASIVFTVLAIVKRGAVGIPLGLIGSVFLVGVPAVVGAAGALGLVGLVRKPAPEAEPAEPPPLGEAEPAPPPSAEPASGPED